MPVVGSPLQHRIGDKPAGLPIFGREVVLDHAVFLNGVRRYGSIRAAGGGTGIRRVGSAQSLIVVVKALDQVVAGAAARSVDCSSPVGTAVHGKGDVALHGTGQQVDEVVLIARLERHLLPHATVDQVRDRRLGCL